MKFANSKTKVLITTTGIRPMKYRNYYPKYPITRAEEMLVQLSKQPAIGFSFEACDCLIFYNLEISIVLYAYCLVVC